MAKFKSKYFDEAKYKAIRQEQETAKTIFADAVENLNDEGISTDYKFIMKLAQYTDNDYLDYIKATFKEYINSLGPVVKAERKKDCFSIRFHV